MAAGFGRHGMPPPAADDTGTTLGQDGSDWSHDLATLTFDLLAFKKVENLPSEFGHARPSGSPVNRYVRDGRTNGQNERLLPPFLRAGA